MIIRIIMSLCLRHLSSCIIFDIDTYVGSSDHSSSEQKAKKEHDVDIYETYNKNNSSPSNGKHEQHTQNRNTNNSSTSNGSKGWSVKGNLRPPIGGRCSVKGNRRVPSRGGQSETDKATRGDSRKTD